MTNDPSFPATSFPAGRLLHGYAAIFGLLVTATIGVATAAPYELRDLATPYASLWDETRDLPAAERVAAFKTRFDSMLPGFFTAARAGWSDEQYDAAISGSFDKFPAIRERFMARTAGLSRLLAPAHASFARAFPDLRPIGPIYIVHSLGEFDGGTRAVGGVNRLMFGADVIAQLHDSPDERPFFQHELFHVYHARYFTECEQMWCSLWAEGLAVLVAQRLNPRATDAELLLSLPRPIRPEVEAHRQQAICAVASRLDSNLPADYAALFSFRSPAPELPPRFGYFVGYLVAQDAARNRSLRTLAHLGNRHARGIVNAALAHLASCEAGSP